MEISKKSRVWVYQSNKPFSLDQELSITAKLQGFINQWEAHGNKLSAKAEIRYNRFIILMVDEEHAGATGCSIDKSVNLMKEIEQDCNIDLFDRFNIAWRTSNGIQSCGREEFEKCIQHGEITEDTIVFNNLIQTVEELETNWEIPYKKSWHQRVFGELVNG